MTSFRNLAATLVCGVAAIAVTASAFAQAQFRDEKTGKVWTPDNVSKDNQLRPSNEPSTPADRAFDPKAQIATATGVVVQRPNATLMGVVPITAGPTVPIVVIDSPTLQAVPGDRWVAPLYLTNNSGADANARRRVPVSGWRLPPTGHASTSSSIACSAACLRPDRSQPSNSGNGPASGPFLFE